MPEAPTFDTVKFQKGLSAVLDVLSWRFVPHHPSSDADGELIKVLQGGGLLADLDLVSPNALLLNLWRLGFAKCCALAIEHGADPGISVTDLHEVPAEPEHDRSTWYANLGAGCWLDARDTTNKWYPSTVLMHRATEVLIHFDGWSSSWDEWIPRHSDRLDPLRTHVADYPPLNTLLGQAPLHRDQTALDTCALGLRMFAVRKTLISQTLEARRTADQCGFPAPVSAVVLDYLFWSPLRIA